MELLHSGKVRDVYADGDDLILVASDRVSVYDVVLPTPIPDKGAVLTRLSLWWFEQLADLVPNHVISATDVPAEFAGRAIRCRRLEMVPVECIARGYLTGLGLQGVRATGAVSGRPLPAGPGRGVEAARADLHPDHQGAARRARRVHHLRRRGRPRRARRPPSGCGGSPSRSTGAAPSSPPSAGIIVADTKLEFGWAPDGTLVLADEVLTSDSSRFWPADDWQPGRTQFSFDKQYVRDWATGTGWDKTAARDRRCPPRSSRRPAPATSRPTSASPAAPGDPLGARGRRARSTAVREFDNEARQDVSVPCGYDLGGLIGCGRA